MEHTNDHLNMANNAHLGINKKLTAIKIVF